MASGLAFFGPDCIDVLYNITGVLGPGDIDGDGDLDVADLGRFVGVLLGTNPDLTQVARSDLTSRPGARNLGGARNLTGVRSRTRARSRASVKNRGRASGPGNNCKNGD